MNPFHSRVLPVEVAVWRSGEQGIHARGVGAVARHHLVGRDDIAQRLGHLGAILDDHALGEQPLGGLAVLDQAEVAHELGPEAGIDQVQNGVFDAADVLIDGEPVIDHGSCRTAVAGRLGIAIEIPGRIDEGVHGIGLAARAALRISGTSC